MTEVDALDDTSVEESPRLATVGKKELRLSNQIKELEQISLWITYASLALIYWNSCACTETPWLRLDAACELAILVILYRKCGRWLIIMTLCILAVMIALLRPLYLGSDEPPSCGLVIFFAFVPRLYRGGAQWDLRQLRKQWEMLGMKNFETLNS